MGVFLRWGVFGILAVAALVYAYNASKRLSERRPPPAAPVVSQAAGEEPEDEEDEAADDPSVTEDDAPDAGPPMPEACVEERLVAERALKMRRDGEPLDRLLRIDRIAFQSDERRRARLEAVARRWFEREGRDPDASALGAEVARDCRKALAEPVTPAP
jgi:type IV secretory pathway VirB10-like protein